jgi:hypothetical protein
VASNRTHAILDDRPGRVDNQPRRPGKAVIREKTMASSPRFFLFALVAALAAFGLRGESAGRTAEQRKSTGATEPTGRDRPPMPEIARPVMFNTPEADRILAALQVYPQDNPWNEDISRRPLHRNSKNVVASVGREKNLAYNLDMAFILVPPNQKRVSVKLSEYSAESDPGPYPVPDNAPIEGWPMSGQSLETIQREGDGDRHVIVVDPFNRMLYEFYSGRKDAAGWTAMQASIFDLKSNKLRPDGWTSSDAAGLPIFPSIVRFDEVERGSVDHALRFTIRNSRKGYVYPATHFASSKTNVNLPRMGERFRLRADFDISRFSPHPQAILKALKKHGMFVADNGGDWRISVAPDSRIKDLDELRRIKGSDFEVIEPTGPRARR